MSANSAMIEVRELVKIYGLQPVLRKLDLMVERGEFVVLLGPNGSGKSTLLRHLAGLTPPTGGTITIGGWLLPHEAAAVRAQIGMVSHKLLLYENLTARENLNFFARLYNLPRADAAERIEALLSRVGLARRGDDLVRTYSRGMQQRLSIARALLHQPHVLLLDEPYTGLDQDASRVLDTLLEEAHADGHTIVMTTHELARAATLPTRVLILNRGVIAFDQPRSSISTDTLPAIYSDVTGMASAR